MAPWKFVRKYKEEFLIAAIFSIWRAGLFIVSFCAQFLLPFKKSFPYADSLLVPTGLPQWLWSWGNFDGVHYLTLAQRGYDGFGTQVFFPLYPLFGNILSYLAGSQFVSLFLISNLSILIGAIVFFKLIKKYFDIRTAFWSVIFLFCFPMSFFFGAIYTESLFLLLTLLIFSLSGIKSIVIGVLAGFTRLIGAFTGLFSFIGLLLYMSYLWFRFGKPLFFLSAQSAFGSRATSFTGLVTPFQTIFRYFKIFATVNSSSYDFWIAVLEFGAFSLGFAVLAWLTIKRKLPIRWLFFSWAAYILPTLSGTFSSMPRYLLPIFPIYLAGALIKNSNIKIIIAIICAFLLAVFTALFTRGYWVS